MGATPPAPGPRSAARGLGRLCGLSAQPSVRVRDTLCAEIIGAVAAGEVDSVPLADVVVASLSRAGAAVHTAIPASVSPLETALNRDVIGALVRRADRPAGGVAALLPRLYGDRNTGGLIVTVVSAPAAYRGRSAGMSGAVVVAPATVRAAVGVRSAGRSTRSGIADLVRPAVATITTIGIQRRAVSSPAAGGGAAGP